MVTDRICAGTGGRWLATACALSLWLAPHAAMAQQQQTPPGTVPGATTPGTPVPGTGATAAVDFQALNRSLQVERILAQFFTINAGKDYLTTVPVTDPGTGTGNTPGDGTGTTTPAVDSGAAALTATLSGAEETPPVTTSATGTATFNFNQDRTQLAYDVRVTGLSGPATGMHIHRGARGEPGDIIYPLTTPDANGVATGSVTVNAADVDGLMQGAFYLNVHTAANPAGEIRGQVVAAAAPTPGITPGTTPGTTTGLDSLRGIVNEIRAGHTAHVTLLEQALGTNAQPVPTYQNLDAPTLQQFLTMAITLEDFAVSAHQGVVQAWLTSGTDLGDPATANQPGSARSLLTSIIAVALADARYAGALRAFQRGASTAIGGNPNTTITEDGGAQNVARDAAQVDQFLQQYIVTPGTAPGTAPGTTPGSTPGATPGTAPGTTPGTTPGTPTPGATPGTPAPNTGTGTAPY